MEAAELELTLGYQVVAVARCEHAFCWREITMLAFFASCKCILVFSIHTNLSVSCFSHFLFSKCICYLTCLFPCCSRILVHLILPFHFIFFFFFCCCWFYTKIRNKRDYISQASSGIGAQIRLLATNEATSRVSDQYWNEKWRMPAVFFNPKSARVCTWVLRSCPILLTHGFTSHSNIWGNRNGKLSFSPSCLLSLVYQMKSFWKKNWFYF